MFILEDSFDKKCIENFPEGYWWYHRSPKAVKAMPQRNINHVYDFDSYRIKVSKDKANFETIHRLIKKKIDATESLIAVYDQCCWQWHTEYSAPHIHHKFNWKQMDAFKNNKSCVEELVFLTNFMVKTGFTLSFLRSKNIFNMRNYLDLHSGGQDYGVKIKYVIFKMKNLFIYILFQCSLQLVPHKSACILIFVTP